MKIIDKMLNSSLGGKSFYSTIQKQAFPGRELLNVISIYIYNNLSFKENYYYKLIIEINKVNYAKFKFFNFIHI